ncbi:hypothetical protein MW887_008174 [Aspergillus wentii]|nr:hypothetical protein MW887_008174 [Aspergillus wentii]
MSLHESTPGFSNHSILLAVAKDRPVNQLELLLDHDAELNINDIKDEQNRDLLYYAALGNSEENVRYLLERGMKPAAQPTDQPSVSPLFPAVNSGNAAIVNLLLDHGANPEIRAADTEDDEYTREVETPLAVAVKAEHYDLMELLFKRGVDPHNEINATSLALCWAAYNCNIALVTRFLDMGFDVNSTAPIVWYIRSSVLSIAVNRGAKTKSADAEALIKLLLERGADVNSPTGYNEMAPLAYATDSHWEAAAKILLENGANPKQMDGDGMTAFWRAAEQNQVGIMKLFLDHAVKEEWKGDYTRAAVSGAELYEAHDVLKLLKEHLERYPIQHSECCGCE